jgi:hypothetical protein
MIGFPSVLIVYTVARIAFVLFYYFGLQPFRSIAFVVGALMLIVVGMWGLVLFSIYYHQLAALPLIGGVFGVYICGIVITFLEFFR